MTNPTLIQPAEIVHLSGISWHTYETLLNGLSASCRLRLTYYRGNLERLGKNSNSIIIK